VRPACIQGINVVHGRKILGKRIVAEVVKMSLAFHLLQKNSW